MSIDFNKWVQRRLTAHGFVCDADGLIGTKTRGCLVAFQRRHRIRATGTTTQLTIAALRLDPAGRDTGPAKVFVQPPWLAELRRRMGLHEVRDHGVLSKWLKSDGKTLGDPRRLPWCGDAIQTAIALTLPHEPMIANPYLARNWLKFGEKTTPREGAVAVFWRGSRNGTSGHVALITGQDDTAFHVIGGNQSNAITETRIGKDRLLGTRWPVTFDLDTSIIARAANGALSTNEA